jgi:mitogen-activated protein kinase organizer 1
VSTTSSTHRLFDTSDGSLLQTFTGHTNTYYRCHSTLTSTEDAVLAGDEKGRLRGWDVLSGKEVDVANGRTSSAPEHDKTILWTECNPKKMGEVVTSGAYGSVKVWSG